MAIQKPWIFLQNPILNATASNYKLSVRISTYHINALKSKTGDAFFTNLATAYQPRHTALVNAYTLWKGQGGTQLGQTLNVNQLFALLRGTKIRKWDIAIQGIYDKTSPAYKALLPSGRMPFQTGTQTDRLVAVKALYTATAAIPQLSAVTTDATAFYTQLNTALDTQKGSITGTKTNSDTVEAARVAVCLAQYANLGALMQLYFAQPDNINQYFDLTAIRNGAQVLYTGDTKPLETENIFKHTFAAGDTLLLTNDGNSTLQFFIAAQKTAAVADAFVSVAAGQDAEISVARLGWESGTYFNVYNPDTINTGEWTVEFV